MIRPAGVSSTSFQRPFLKWPGNKYRILHHLLPVLPTGSRLLEPFVGSGAVFLNTDYPGYVLNDINPDLIHLYENVRDGGPGFIDLAASLFTARNNRKDTYYRLRERFNATDEAEERSALLIYLNRHGYNGLVRYNARGGFNVPFGRYKRPYFPRDEMEHFRDRAQGVRFTCVPFETALADPGPGTVVYADPPYVPLSPTSSFTAYSGAGFNEEQQRELARMAGELSASGIPVLISNHDTPFTREAYRSARITSFPVRRTISCKGDQRNEVGELLALFEGAGPEAVTVAP